MVVKGLKADSRKVSSHKRRELYWDAYGKMSSKCAAIDGAAHVLMTYKADGEGGGIVEIVDLTKRQRGLVGGGCEIMGRKIKPPEADATYKSWCMAWSENSAMEAWDDLMSDEPCVYAAADGVFCATRHKRVMCNGFSSGPPKTMKDIEALVADLKPDNPLRSISFAGNNAPSLNPYNFFLAGSWVPAAVVAALPAHIGHVASTSSLELYSYFQTRKSMQLLREAEQLIAQMLVDVNKGLMPLISASSMKEAAAARKNSLMKKVYAHESKTKFIESARVDEVDLQVISGNIEGTKFGEYGGIVFELFYRADLSVF